jgi:hypothetical protein
VCVCVLLSVRVCADSASVCVCGQASKQGREERLLTVAEGVGNDEVVPETLAEGDPD